eukprot:TRINITY_DN6951_c2_g2_i1.p2 TRINITY_DN6951_c2_g2~~TRINITY_DN6951_c2_g2_i1.p2  ORF type:complete len:161 (-),score=1.69 TRINITY_DN6951_c2_g2_i1:80-562(-)
MFLYSYNKKKYSTIDFCKHKNKVHKHTLFQKTRLHCMYVLQDCCRYNICGYDEMVHHSLEGSFMERWIGSRTVALLLCNPIGFTTTSYLHLKQGVSNENTFISSGTYKVTTISACNAPTGTVFSATIFDSHALSAFVTYSIVRFKQTRTLRMFADEKFYA